MADTHIAGQTLHVTGPKHIADQTVILTQKQLILKAGNNTGSVLTTMLQHRQGIIDGLINMGFSNDPHNSAHARITSAETKKLMGKRHHLIGSTRQRFTRPVSQRGQMRDKDRVLPPGILGH